MLRDVKIVSVLNGWIVTVGCQRVVFNDMESMLGEIRKYLKDPCSAEKSYRNAVNAKHTFEATEATEEIVLEDQGRAA